MPPAKRKQAAGEGGAAAAAAADGDAPPATRPALQDDLSPAPAVGAKGTEIGLGRH